MCDCSEEQGDVDIVDISTSSELSALVASMNTVCPRNPVLIGE